MSPSLVWANLIAYSVQVLVLVAVGGLLPRLFRIHQPRTQLLYLRFLLAGSLLLPALQPWRRPVVTMTPLPAAATAPVARPASPLPAKPQIRWEEVGLTVVGTGVSLRMLWLLMGMWRLRRLRLTSEPLEPLPEAFEAARLRTGAKAAVCLSDEVGGPVTFGARRPVVLFPPALLEQPYTAQFGIACHEFLHVRRRDWLYTVVEEFAGALVWFHPAVWWLLGQIRLAREQVVDREVVSITEAQEPYVHALLAMGGGRPQLDLAPATLFLRKRHLASRVHSLLKEVTMSTGRLISSYVLTAAAVLAAAWFTIGSFPLEASPAAVAQQRPASQGVVRVELAPNLPEPLRSNLRARMAAFQGRPYTLGMRAEILKAAKEVDPAAIILSMSQSESADGLLVATFVLTAGERGSPPPPPQAPPGVTVRQVVPASPQGPVHIDVSQLPEPLRSTTQAQLAPLEGQWYTSDLRNLVTKALTKVDPKARWVLSAPRRTVDGPVTLTVVLAPAPAGFPPSSDSSLFWYFPRSSGGPPAPADSPPSGVQRIPVNIAAQATKLLQWNPPEYPPLAR